MGLFKYVLHKCNCHRLGTNNISGKPGKLNVNFGDTDAAGFKRDQKFEGHSRSSLKEKDQKQKAKTAKSSAKTKDKQLQEEYIGKLQNMVATLESQIKLLKSREVDQKNKASGYETLLRDKIPLNEHFLALKNKYNKEKDQLDKQLKVTQEEIERDKA